MQKSWFGSRRCTGVRQRAKTRLKTHVKIEIRKNFYIKISLYHQILDSKAISFFIFLPRVFVLRWILGVYGQIIIIRGLDIL